MALIITICIILVIAVLCFKFKKSNQQKQKINDGQNGIVCVHKGDQCTIYDIDGPGIYDLLIDIPSRKETLFVSRLPEPLHTLVDNGEVSIGQWCLKKNRKDSVIFGDGHGNSWAIRKSAKSSIWKVYRIDKNNPERDEDDES